MLEDIILNYGEGEADFKRDLATHIMKIILKENLDTPVQKIKIQNEPLENTNDLCDELSGNQTFLLGNPKR